jgi:hypothetical protein
MGLTLAMADKTWQVPFVLFWFDSGFFSGLRIIRPLFEQKL